MQLGNLSWGRSLGSYSAVQRALSRWKRNRRGQLANKRIKGLAYVDVGAGPNTHSNFVNIDYQWRPDIDLCWDVTKGLPFADGSMRGVFSEHCLEHLPLAAGVDLLTECRRILTPGGILRIIVPNAEIYLRAYSEAAGRFPYGDEFLGFTSPVIAVNRAFYQDRASPFGHVWMYDLHLLEQALRRAGFSTILQQRFGEGDDPTLLIDTPSRRVESLYVEAS